MPKLSLGFSLRRSPAGGLGVFASRSFRPGETVLRWDCSRALAPGEFDALPREERRFVAFAGGKHLLMVFPERHVNHSCNANTCIEARAYRGGVDVREVAVRAIRRGEEVTADYAHSIPPGVVMECNCGLPQCRKVICREF